MICSTVFVRQPYRFSVVTTSPLTLVCLSPTQEVDDFFEQEKTFLLDYYSKIKDSTAKAEKMTRAHKSIRSLLTGRGPVLQLIYFYLGFNFL